MGSIRVRPDVGLLFFDFRYRGIRCRELSTLKDTLANRKKMELVLDKIESEIAAGTFSYSQYFPNGKMVGRHRSEQLSDARSISSETQTTASKTVISASPKFESFVPVWFTENEVRWRQATRDLNRTLMNRYILPRFGEMEMSSISRASILAFRAETAQPKETEKGSKQLGPRSLNLVMTLLRQVLTEASVRYEFSNPTLNIKPIKVPRKDIQPFSLEEVRQILAAVRVDYKNYMTVRFFTAMRSAEVHGLKWRYVDFDRRQILVCETFAKNRTEYTKNDSSQREIEMSQQVHDALRAQQEATAKLSEYVFCTRDGAPLDEGNVTKRVWHPLLRLLGLRPRRPYQTRRTCAILWLGAGENPEWIGKQMGHTTTAMLFKVYSRFIPNLARRDGSAFDRMVSAALNSGISTDRETVTNATNGGLNQENSNEK